MALAVLAAVLAPAPPVAAAEAAEPVTVSVPTTTVTVGPYGALTPEPVVTLEVDLPPGGSLVRARVTVGKLIARTIRCADADPFGITCTRVGDHLTPEFDTC